VNVGNESVKMKSGGNSSRQEQYLAVRWPDDDLNYRAKVVRKRVENNGDCRLLVKYYVDGDTEWIDSTTAGFCELESKVDQLPPRKVSPSLDQATVGTRISVWWPGEKQYYGAIIKRIKDGRSEPFRLYYDDGDKEWTDLSSRKFVLGAVGGPIKPWPDGAKDST